jgi:cytochrome c oxidase assembly protein subunit 15
VASAALLLVITMVAVCLTARPPMWREGRVALGLLALALFLAVLGRWSSNARVPAVAIGNLLGGFGMLALCWRVVRRGTRPATPWLRAWAGLGVALLLVQVGLGGLLSASYAAGSCAGLAECIAASASVPWSALDPWREPVLAFTPPVNPSGALAQTTHRLSGLAVLIVVLPLGIAAACKGRRRHGVLLLALLAAELALGLRMTGSVSLAPALAHNVVAALLLATAFDLTRGSGAARSP